jgi:hypothetical protein
MRFNKPVETAVENIREGSVVKVKLYDGRCLVGKVCPCGIVIGCGGVKVRVFHGQLVSFVDHSQISEVIEY